MLRHGSPRALAVARTVRSLALADDLPGHSDFEATVRPVGRAWVRRVAEKKPLDLVPDRRRGARARHRHHGSTNALRRLNF
jgi:hypothetical protein